MPPCGSQPDQPPANHLCQTALSPPRTNMSSRPGCQLAMAGPEPAARQQPSWSSAGGAMVWGVVVLAVPRLTGARTVVQLPGPPLVEVSAPTQTVPGLAGSMAAPE